MTDTYELELELDQPRARVWRALTDPVELERWFCEHADVDLDAGRFDFWGRHTPGAPGREEARHPVLSCEPMRRLQFGWPLRGADSTVTITLEGDTTIRVLHEGLSPRRQDASHLPSHHWRFVLGALRAFLATGHPGPRFDWSAPHLGGFTAHADIAAPPGDVWRGVVVDGWLDPENPRRVDAPDDDADFGMDFGYVTAVKVVELDEPTSFAIRMSDSDETVLTYLLEGSGGTTHITIVQSGYADPDEDVEGVAEGYFTGVLEVAWELESAGSWRRGGPGSVRVIQDGRHDRRTHREKVGP